MRLVYFARVREAVGVAQEDRILPAHILTVKDCTDWLVGEGGHYAAAFADRAGLRFALDQKMVGEDVSLREARELAIFPPVTGG